MKNVLAAGILVASVTFSLAVLVNAQGTDLPEQSLQTTSLVPARIAH